MKTAIRLMATVVVLIMHPTAMAREWTDSTGTFKVEAELADVSGDAVQLRKADGSVVSVPIGRLSVADQQYVRSQAAARGRQKPADGDPEQRIRTALASPTRLEFIKTPIVHVLAFLSEQHGIPILIDERAWDDAGIDTRLPVTCEISGLSLAETLDKLLKQYDLAWVIRDDVVLVTTPEETEAQPEVIVYRLKKPANFDGLIGGITRNVQPNSWANVGGPGSVAVFPPQILIVSQTQAVQREIQQRYADLIQPVRAKPAALPLVEKPLADALTKLIDLHFTETPLGDVVAFFQTQSGLPVTLDQRALGDAGIGPDVPVNIRVQGIRLRSALSLILRPLELTWVPRGREILITSPAVAGAMLNPVSHPAGDLIGGGDVTQLVKLIQSIVAPQTWDRVGGPGSVRPGVGGKLEVRHYFRVQEWVAQLLADLRVARK